MRYIHIQTFDIRTANDLNNCIAYTASAITNLYMSPFCAFPVLYNTELISTQGHVTAEPHAANLARDLELKLTQSYIVLGRRRQATYKDS